MSRRWSWLARASASSLSERAVVVALVALGVELVQASLVAALARIIGRHVVSKLVPQRTWVADAAVEQLTKHAKGVAQLAHRADAVNHRRTPQRVVVEQPLELARVLVVSHSSTCRRAGSTAVLGPLARVVPRRRAQWLRVARPSCGRGAS